MGRRIPRFAPFVALAVVLVGGCACKPLLNESLTVTSHPQETGMWCWAASGQMVMDYLGHGVAQCTQANNRFGRSDCCNIALCPNPTGSHACVTGGWPEFGKYGFTFTRTSSTALTWDQVRNDVSSGSSCGHKPFAFTWAWIGGGGHMMVAVGYQTQSGVNWVEVLDPWAPCVGDRYWITYDEYVQRAGDHTHWDDFYNVVYKGGT